MTGNSWQRIALPIGEESLIYCAWLFFINLRRVTPVRNGVAAQLQDLSKLDIIGNNFERKVIVTLGFYQSHFLA